MSRDLKNYLMFEFFASSLTPMSSTLEQANQYTDTQVSGAIAECKQYTDNAASVLDTKIDETTADILQDANTYTDTEIADILATMDNVIKITSNITSSELNEILADTNKKVKNIYFTAGTYTLGDIRLKSNTHIILDKNAVINVVDKHLFFNFETTDTEVLGYDGQGNITIEGGTINGHIASFIHGENITIRNIKANDCYNDHYIELSACKDVLIKDNIFSGMITQTVERNYVEYVQIDNCTYNNFPHLGNESSTTFDLTPNINIKIYDNEFKKSQTTNYDNIYTAIGTHSSVANYHQNIEIKGNRFYNASHAAIAIRGWRYALIQNNYFNTCESALQIKYGSSDISFIDNFVQKSNNAIYTYNSNTSTFYFLKIARNKFDECVHRLVCEVDESVTPIVNGGQIWDTDNRIEDSGTDIIRYKRDVFSFNNSYKRVNIQNLGYVHLFDNVVGATIKDNRYASVYIGDLTSFNIAKAIGDSSNIVIKDNKTDDTMLHNLVDNAGNCVYTDEDTILITDISLNTLISPGRYSGVHCTDTPSEVDTAYFTLDVSGRAGYLTQTLTMSYSNLTFVRTYHNSVWTAWQKVARAEDINKVNILNAQDLDAITQTGEYYGVDCINTPADVTTAKFTLKVINNDGWISQELYYIYGNKLYARTNYEGWKPWVGYGDMVSGISVYAPTHGAGANMGSGTWIAGGSKSNFNFAARAKSAIVIGSDTCKNTNTLVDLVAIGDKIVQNGVPGEHTIAIGLMAGWSLNAGSSPSSKADRNIFIGSLSYPALIDGRCNTGLGRDTGQCCVRGSFNVALGYQAIAGQAPVDFKREIAHWWDGTFSHVIGIGYQAGQQVTKATANNFIGSFAARNVKSGSYSNVIGYNAGKNLENDRSYNDKKVIDVSETATYTTDGTDNIIITRTGHQAQLNNYVTVAFTSGVCKDLSTEQQLMYVNALTDDTFTLTAITEIVAGSGSCIITRYEKEIEESDIIGLLNSSNILGTGACYFTKRVNQSNVIGMRAANRIEADSSDIIGFSTFYGLTDVGIVKESQIIGANACYNVPNVENSVISGYNACYNANTRMAYSNVSGSNAAFTANDIFRSVVNGETCLYKANTISESTASGQWCGYGVGNISLSNIIGNMIAWAKNNVTIVDSDVMGARACYNTENMEMSVAIGRGNMGNTKSSIQSTSVGASNQHVFDLLKNCSFFGYAAGQTTSKEILELENCTCIGFATGVTGDYQVQLGNASTTVYVYGTVQNRSDIRDKADIRDTILGLDFINKLRPVDFKWDIRESYIDVDDKGNQIKNPEDGSRKRKRYHHGLIAQEVEALLKAMGIDFGGYQDHSINGGSDVKSLGYDEFIAPIIKSVQELSAKVQSLENKIKEMELSK